MVQILEPYYVGCDPWLVRYGEPIKVSFDDVRWLADFQSGIIPAPPKSALDVDLEESIATDQSGEITGEPCYRIKKVHGVVDIRKTVINA